MRAPSYAAVVTTGASGGTDRTAGTGTGAGPGTAPTAAAPTARPVPGRRPRVVGVDVARGLAVLGMFTAHLGAYGEQWRSPVDLLHVADGRSAALFALLAGVSTGLMTGGPVPPAGPHLHRAVVRVLVRCAVLWLVGLVMVALGTPVAVILPSYALVLAVAVVALPWPPWASLSVAAVSVLLGPLVLLVARRASEDGVAWLALQPVDILVGQYYPGVVWMGYVLVGLAVARADLDGPRAPVLLVGAGAVLTVVGYGTGAYVGARVTDPTLRTLLSVEPHADTAPELTGNIGVGLVVLGLCVAVGRAWPRLVEPLAAVGTLAFTAYCGHLVAIAILGDLVVWNARNSTLVAFVVVTVAVAWAWRAFVRRRGPLEWLLHQPSVLVADALVPAAVRRPS